MGSLLRRGFVPLLAALLGLAPDARAQPRPSITGEADASVIVQRYSTGESQAVRETSAPFGVSVRHRSGFGASLRGLYASAGGDGLEPLSGLANVQLDASIRRRVGQAAIEASLGAANTGRGSTLLDAEFATAAALSFDDYAFDVPTLGQGTTLSPALTAVVSAGRGLALGVGAAYYVRGGFVPFEGGTLEYDPADETVVTAGLTAQTGRASTFALDAALVAYGEDTYDRQTFSPGQRVSGTARWAWGGGAVRGHLLAHYRHVFEGTVGANSRPVAYQRPEHARVATGLGFYGAGSGVEVSVGARYYGTIRSADDTLDLLGVLGDQQVLIDVGATPTIQIVPGARLIGTFTYTFGIADALDIAETVGVSALSGFRAGGGIQTSF